MADRPKTIPELPSASGISGDDYTIVEQVVSDNSATNKATVNQVGSHIATSMEFSGLDTTDKHIIGAINEISQGGGGASTLDDLTDVDVDDSQLGTNQVLLYDGGLGYWINHGIFLSGSGTIQDVNALAPSNNDVLMWDGTYAEWENKGIIVGNDYDVGTIKDVSVDTSSLANRQTLLYNSTNSEWINGKLQFGHEGAASDFNDVQLSQSINNNDLLMYDYSNNYWKNGKLFIEQYGMLTTGATSVSITVSDPSVVLANASLEVYTDTFGVNPTNITISGSIITLTFAAQASDVIVKVRLWK